MNREWSTFADGADCRECSQYEKEIARLRQQVEEKDKRIGELERIARERGSLMFNAMTGVNEVAEELNHERLRREKAEKEVDVLGAGVCSLVIAAYPLEEALLNGKNALILKGAWKGRFLAEMDRARHTLETVRRGREGE